MGRLCNSIATLDHVFKRLAFIAKIFFLISFFNFCYRIFFILIGVRIRKQETIVCCRKGLKIVDTYYWRGPSMLTINDKNYAIQRLRSLFGLQSKVVF